MNSDKVFELYEKLYFHEIEAREKIAARLQIPLAILLSIISVYALFFRGLYLDFKSWSSFDLFFAIFMFVSVILFCLSSYFFIRAFYGHTYEFLPLAKDSEKYRQDLVETYKSYGNCDQLVKHYFKEYIFTYYSDCASKNASINDKRSERLHKCNTFIILNSIPLVLAFIFFTFATLERNGVEKQYKVKIDNPVVIKLPETRTTERNGTVNMTDTTKSEQPPLPPPPPPKRLIREDVQTPYNPIRPEPKPQKNKGD